MQRSCCKPIRDNTVLRCMDRQIVDKFDVARQTVEKVRKRCVEEGLEAALGRRQRSRDRAPVLDGEGGGATGRHRL